MNLGRVLRPFPNVSQVNNCQEWIFQQIHPYAQKLQKTESSILHYTVSMFKFMTVLKFTLSERLNKNGLLEMLAGKSIFSLKRPSWHHGSGLQSCIWMNHKILWSGETRAEMFDHGALHHEWKPSQHMSTKTSYQLSAQWWTDDNLGSFWTQRTLDIESAMNSFVYQSILESNVRSSDCWQLKFGLKWLV